MSDTEAVPSDAKPARRSGLAIATAWLLGAGIPLIAVAFGIWLVKRNLSAAAPEFVMRYVFGERALGPLSLERDIANPADPGADLASDIHDAITRDWSVIAGYFLILLVCALVSFVIMSAFSNSGKMLSYVILAAVVVATGMDILENLLILWSTNPPNLPEWLRMPERFWVVAPAAVATVKWCALIVALCAVPAAAFASSRVLVSYISRWIRQSRGATWWDRVLVPKPEPTTPLDAEDDIESSWRQAYYVPGAEDLLTEDHGTTARTATALCLSGGGIRSGCVAMGAMQTLSREPDGAEPPRWGTAPLLGRRIAVKARTVRSHTEDPIPPEATPADG